GSSDPCATVLRLLASASADPRIGPMHGAAQMLKAAPRANDPRRRAVVTRLGAINCFGMGSRPMKASPKTTRISPAISDRRAGASTLPIPAAPAPRATKTTVNPSMNGRLPRSTRRATPGSPSRSASTAETADRYPGTSGSTHGVRIEISPKAKASGIWAAKLVSASSGAKSALEAGELLVEPALQFRLERALAARAGRLAPPAPAPGPEAEGGSAGGDPCDRQPPREQVEPFP